MKQKPFVKTTIATEEASISIMPSETENGIIIETKERNEVTRLYLNKQEAFVLVTKIVDMINYLEL